MRPEFLAILSAMGWAADSILVRKGARFSNIFGAAFISYLVTSVCLWSIITLSLSFQQLRSQALFYFMLSGLLQPLLARILHYMGITRLGVSRSGPLRGLSPLFALMLAVLFLDERPNSFVYGGTILTVVGVWFILSRQGEEREWRVFDLVFPLGAAFIAAVSQNLRKMGLLMLPNPLIGAAVTTSTSLIVFFVSLLLMGKIRLIRLQRASMPFFGSAAFIATGAQLLVFVSLSRGEVSVMVPLFNMNPLFSVIFSALFLRDLEKVTSKTFIGVILLVAGVALITNR